MKRDTGGITNATWGSRLDPNVKKSTVKIITEARVGTGTGHWMTVVVCLCHRGSAGAGLAPPSPTPPPPSLSRGSLG